MDVMAGLNADVEGLKGMLEENRQSLVEVEKALNAQPEGSNEELVKLKKDLEEVIRVTEELVISSTSHQDGSFQTLAEHGIAEPPDRVGDPVAKPSQPASQPNSIIGRTCVFEAHGSKLYGRISKTKREGKGERLIVQVIGFGADEASATTGTTKYMEVDLRAVRLLVPPSVTLLVKGARGQAIWTEDGIWYECVIVDTFDTGRGGQLRARVRFTEYGNEDVVPIDRIRLFGPGGAGNLSGQKRKIKEVTTPGGYKIPEPLQIKPTDSEHQKQLKKKKIALLKKQQRQDTQETEARQRASVWQQHFTGRKKGPKHPIMKSRSSRSSAGSIFSTSDLPDGKVGVTNSGRGMTSFRTRQKHIYEIDEDAEEEDAGEVEADEDDEAGDDDEELGGEEEPPTQVEAAEDDEDDT